MFGFYDILGHFANVLYAVAFLFKDMLWLRAFMIVGCVVDLIYRFGVAATPLWTDITWCAIFIVMNMYQLAILVHEHQSLTLNADERKLYTKVFSSLSTLNFKKLIKTADWKKYPKNAVLIEKGKALDSLLLIYRGSAAVTVDGSLVTYLKDGHFAGEMSFLSGKPTSATVITEKPTRCLLWDKQKLRQLLMQNEELQTGMKSVFNNDLLGKLLHHTKTD